MDPTDWKTVNFLRPVLRTITAAHRGVLLKTPKRDTPTPPSRHLLPTDMTTPFLNWQTSEQPWIRKFRDHIDDFLQLSHPDYTLQQILQSSKDPMAILRHAQSENLIINKSFDFDNTNPEHHLPLQATLNNLTSTALTNLPLQVAANRMTSSAYTLALRRKLRLPITNIRKCKCGQPMDKYGDHLFKCIRHAKTSMHNRIRDSLFLVLRNISPYAALTQSRHDTAREPSGMLPNFPSLRPADIAVKLADDSHDFLLLDVTMIPFPSPIDRIPSLSLAAHHEEYENHKFCRREPKAEAISIMTDMQLNRQQLLPITVDPGGNFGPLATKLFWGSDNSTVTTRLQPSAWDERTKKTLTNRNISQSMLKNTLEHSPTNLLHRADKGWKIQQGGLPFTRHDDTPGNWGHHVISHNTTLAMTLHLQQALSALNSFDATGLSNTNLLTAATIPTYRPTQPFPFARQFSIQAGGIT
jgi:hypothetical protein